MPKDTYCAQPDYNIHIEGDSKNFCCVARGDHSVTGTIAEAFDNFQSVRDALSNGQQHPACSGCWKTERNGYKSARHAYNSQHRDLGHLDQAPTVRSIQWSFSNTCNFACRSCSLDYSTGWLSETRRLAGEGNSDAIELMQRHTKTQWDQQEWQDIKQYLHTVDHLELFGGEPLLNTRLIPTLNSVDDSIASGINLVLTTNGSQAPRAELIDCLSRFKSIRITFSLDAVTDESFAYVRTGSWQQVSQTVQQWKDVVGGDDKFVLWANPTFSVLNIWDSDRILKHLDKWFGWDHVGWNWVSRPTCYDAVNMPQHIKDEIMLKSTYWRSRKLMDQMCGESDDSSQWQEFLRRQTWLDQSRDQPMKKFMPELYNLIYTSNKD